MAIPIAISPKTPESKCEIEGRLDEARVAHAKAILSAYELLQELHDARILDLLRGALGAGDSIVTKLAVASNSEESINVVRNLISLTKILGNVDPNILHAFADGIALQKKQKAIAPKASLWGAVRMLTSADSRRALVGAGAFLQAFGRALKAS
jgi:uncharacterized protein YjgD (DUF1641 family)